MSPSPTPAAAACTKCGEPDVPLFWLGGERFCVTCICVEHWHPSCQHEM